MCGIAGFHIKTTKHLTKAESQQAEDFLDSLLLEIESRGHDATGFVAMDQGSKKVLLDKQAITAKEFINKRKPLPKEVRTVLGHTRWQTQGSAEKDFNNHPVVYGSTFVTHNGTIRNDTQVFKDLKLKRNAEVDSEAIAAALHSFGFGKVDEAMAKLSGGFACAAINPIKNKDTVLLFKGPNWPISFYEDKKVFAWASTGLALRAAWKAAFDFELEWKDISTAYEGDVITVVGNKVTRKSRPVKFRNQHIQEYEGAEQYCGSEEAWDRWSREEKARKPWTINRTPKRTPTKGTITLNAVDRTAKLRDEGYGKARTFKDRESIKNIAKNDLQWHMCTACRIVILAADFVEHKLYGKICIDCNPDKRLEISKEEIVNLEEFVDHEEYVYTEALASTSHLTGISIPAVDYLVSRARLDNSGDAFRALHGKVKKVFDVEQVKAWEAYKVEMDEEKEEATGILADSSEFWVSCSGEVHKSTEPCDNCKGLLPGQKRPLAEKVESPTPKKNSNKCMLCDKNWKVRNATKIGTMSWCHAHYTKCSFEAEECKGGTVAFDTEGRRWCHIHFRSKKGLQDADSRMQKVAT